MTISVLVPQKFQEPPAEPHANASGGHTIPLQVHNVDSFLKTVTMPTSDALRAIGETVYPKAQLHTLYKTNSLLARLVGAPVREIDAAKIPCLRHEQELIAYFANHHALNYTDPGVVARVSFKMHADSHRCDDPNNVKRGTEYRSDDVPVSNQPSGHLFEKIQASSKIICDDDAESMFPVVQELTAWESIKRSVRSYMGCDDVQYSVPMGFESALKQQVFETIGEEMMRRIEDGVLNRSMEEALAESEKEMGGRIVTLPVAQQTSTPCETIKFQQ